MNFLKTSFYFFKIDKTCLSSCGKLVYAINSFGISVPIQKYREFFVCFFLLILRNIMSSGGKLKFLNFKYIFFFFLLLAVNVSIFYVFIFFSNLFDKSSLLTTIFISYNLMLAPFLHIFLVKSKDDIIYWWKCRIIKILGLKYS